MRTRNIVLVLYIGLKGQDGKVRSKVHVGPTVHILFKSTATHKLEHIQVISNNGARPTGKQSNNVIHGRIKKY